MKNEMDALNLDERQKLYWLMANRVTLMIVGLVWIGMIVYEAAIKHIIPYFMIAMVPAFALIRLALFKFYVARD